MRMASRSVWGPWLVRNFGRAVTRLHKAFDGWLGVKEEHGRWVAAAVPQSFCDLGQEVAYVDEHKRVGRTNTMAGRTDNVEMMM